MNHQIRGIIQCNILVYYDYIAVFLARYDSIWLCWCFFILFFKIKLYVQLACMNTFNILRCYAVLNDQEYYEINNHDDFIQAVFVSTFNFRIIAHKNNHYFISYTILFDIPKTLLNLINTLIFIFIIVKLSNSRTSTAHSIFKLT